MADSVPVDEEMSEMGQHGSDKIICGWKNAHSLEGKHEGVLNEACSLFNFSSRRVAIDEAVVTRNEYCDTLEACCESVDYLEALENDSMLAAQSVRLLS